MAVENVLVILLPLTHQLWFVYIAGGARTTYKLTLQKWFHFCERSRQQRTDALYGYQDIFKVNLCVISITNGLLKEHSRRVYEAHIDELDTAGSFYQHGYIEIRSGANNYVHNLVCDISMS